MEKTRQYLSLLGYNSKRKEYNSNTWIQCPFPHGGKRDKHPSMSIREREDSLLFYCTACGYGGNHFSFARDTCSNYQQLTPLIKSIFGTKLENLLKKEFNTSIPFNKFTFGVNEEEKKYLKKIEYIYYKKLDFLSEKHYNFFDKEKNIKKETINAARAKYSSMLNRVIFPIYINRKEFPIVGLQGRIIDNNTIGPHQEENALQKNRWSFLSNFPKENYYYAISENVIKESNYVVVVEGIGDVLRFWQNGIKSTIAIFGASISDYQIEKISFLGKKIFLILDGDIPGRNGVKRFREKIKEKKIEIDYEVISLDSGDPGDLLDEEIISIKKEIEKNK